MRKPSIKNLKKASDRVIKAIKDNENIILYGDSDLDGITSVIILQETIKNLGGEVTALYFPDREQGYGITEIALDSLKKHAPALFVVLDCGISNFKEIDIANELGFEVIVIDHHQILEKLPNASIIVDPKQKGETYPFKDFANVGLAFKFAEVTLKDKMNESLRRSFLELTAMATIADMMPREQDNADMISEGLSTLESSWRPGIQALLSLKEVKKLSLLEKVSRINSVLNIRDVENGLPAAYRVLTSQTEKQAKTLADILFAKGIEKREKVGKIVDQVEQMIDQKKESIIFEGDSKWELVLLGIVASIISNRHDKPVFLFVRQKEISHGSIRTGSGYDVVKAMKGFADKLITFGGHAQAAGFRIKNEDLEEFKQYLIKYFK